MSALPGLCELRRPQAAFTGVGKRRTSRLGYVKCQAHGTGGQEFGLLPKAGSMALAAALAVSVSVGAITPPPAHADDVFERRRADMQRRKELLSKTREKALAGGGIGSEGEPAGAPSVSAAEEEQVKGANAVVERGNQEREQEALRMRESLKGSLKTYDEAAKKDDKRLKPRTDSPDNPSWFTNLLEKSKKPETSAPSEGNTQPETPPTPSFEQFLKPNEGPQKPAAPPPAPEAPPKPAFSFSSPAEKEERKQPPSSPQPLPPPPELKQEPQPSSPPAFSFESPAPPRPKPEQPTPPLVPKAAPTAPVPLRTKPQQPASPFVPKAAPTEPAPLPKPAAKKGVQPIQPAKRAQKQVEEKKGKRKGPLPAPLVQLLILAAFGGLAYASFEKEEETARVLKVVLNAVSKTYGKVEGLVKKKA